MKHFTNALFAIFLFASCGEPPRLTRQPLVFDQRNVSQPRRHLLTATQQVRGSLAEQEEFFAGMAGIVTARIENDLYDVECSIETNQGSGFITDVGFVTAHHNVWPPAPEVEYSVIFGARVNGNAGILPADCDSNGDDYDDNWEESFDGTHCGTEEDPILAMRLFQIGIESLVFNPGDVASTEYGDRETHRAYLFSEPPNSPIDLTPFERAKNG